MIGLDPVAGQVQRVKHLRGRTFVGRVDLVGADPQRRGRAFVPVEAPVVV
jgi:hypothetical protein